jgi:ribosomal protein S18 acetylase RimI-like enzyme
MEAQITLRPITPQDENFLCRLYASTREDELAVVPWSAAEKEAFLTMQFNAQHKFYQEQFRQAEFQLILLDDEPIGRLYIDRRPDEIRLIDIALLTEQRNKGIGSLFLKEVLAEGERAGLPVRIHVEQYNPALGLYERLGFRKIGDQGVYYLLEWSAGAAVA